MKSERLSIEQRIEHMVEAIERILRFTGDLDYPSFMNEEVVQYAVVKNFEIIGEAAYQIPKKFRLENEQIEWRKIMTFRHILVHEYHKINMEIVWLTIQNKIINLQIELEKLLENKF